VSGAASSWASGIRARVPDLTLLDYAVLQVLADRADAAGQGARPSARTIGLALAVDARSVKRSLARLQVLGVIERGDQDLVMHLDPTLRPVVYDLVMGARLTLTPVDNHPVTEESPGDRGVPYPVTEESPKPKAEPNTKPNPLPPAASHPVTEESPGDPPVTPAAVAGQLPIGEVPIPDTFREQAGLPPASEHRANPHRGRRHWAFVASAQRDASG
jgi:hypothetical protein